MRGEVSLGQRGIVGLGAGLEVRAIDLEDLAAGAPRDVLDRFEQPVEAAQSPASGLL